MRNRRNDYDNHYDSCCLHYNYHNNYDHYDDNAHAVSMCEPRRMCY